ncbi:hypothetical protein PHK61_14740 [Actinomycetospora lutea]|uniref:hypothetical protein n=1 Tax=Actinomycetospora lutea TaxID=663604 RepID=UPI0023668B1E|nr:hypothetical protein [Actinomycetospora lutea]MDD7939679.1 hypothetical protein [Actinomycetospora lutea]
MLRAVATWWDGVELWLTQLDFAAQVVLVVAVVGPVCWVVAAVIDTVVERSVAARLEAAERRARRREQDRASTTPEA